MLVFLNLSFLFLFLFFLFLLSFFFSILPSPLLSFLPSLLLSFCLSVLLSFFSLFIVLSKLFLAYFMESFFLFTFFYKFDTEISHLFSAPGSTLALGGVYVRWGIKCRRSAE